jgi:hypothetical protein
MMERPVILATAGTDGIGVGVAVGVVVGDGTREGVGWRAEPSAVVMVGVISGVGGTAVSVGKAVGGETAGKTGAGSAVGNGVVTSASIASGIYWRTRPGSAAATSGKTCHKPKPMIKTKTRIKPIFANLFTPDEHCNKARDYIAIATKKS